MKTDLSAGNGTPGDGWVAKHRKSKSLRTSVFAAAMLGLAMAVMGIVISSPPAAAQTPFPNPPRVIGKGANGNVGSTGNPAGPGGNGQPGTSFSYYLDQNPVGGATGFLVSVLSQGGNGGMGGPSLGNGQGGNGGGGGDSGVISVRLLASQITSSSTAGAVGLIAQGGQGGEAGYGGGGAYTSGRSGFAGNGGTPDALSLALSVGGLVESSTGGVPAIVVQGIGGNAGDATLSNGGLGSTDGVQGAQGGGGSAMQVHLLGGDVVSAGTGVLLVSKGGNGGAGGGADAFIKAYGGNGGRGGGGSSIIFSTSGGSVITAAGASGPATGQMVSYNGGTLQLSAISAGVLAESQGGIGGKGGTANGKTESVGGAGGGAGHGGQVALETYLGAIETTGYAASGILAESVGGAGGDGAASESWFSETGGNGGAAGAAGTASIKITDTRIETFGDESPDAVAESIGGGGGNGAAAKVIAPVTSVAIGGQGADGGAAGNAVVTNGNTYGKMVGGVLTSSGEESPAIEAQSIAGGGGNGGSATATAIGPVSVSIGGNGADGGQAGQSSAFNDGILETSGDQSPAMLLQSLGGGGGNGGFGASLTVSAQLAVAVAVGGRGGDGGDGGTVSAGNFGQLTTNGPNAYGIEAQSIGGGGGNGGDAISTIISAFNVPQYPSASISVSVGGNAGAGAVGGPVRIENSAYGAVLTRGEDATGLFGESVGGGGGAGGDAGSYNAQLINSTISTTVNVGGTGGTGGTGGFVDESNAGYILTLGDLATGMLAQSVGGGGGDGGVATGDTSGTIPLRQGYSLTASVAVGGSGGAGGNGGAVNVGNTGAVETLGDDAGGIFAQSVGGGGGNGGMGKALSSDGKLSLNAAIGGNGGAGGTGGAVTLANSGYVLTTGGSSPALTAQSVGGGGGTGGDAATGAGTYPILSGIAFLGDRLGVDADVTDEDGAVALTPQGIRSLFSLLALKRVVQAYRNANKPNMPTTGGTLKATLTVRVGGGWAGNGGAGGDGNQVTLQNSGALETDGPDSSAIFAQTVGGGGGTGGAANPASNLLISNPSSVDVVIGVGGSGGSSGFGGNIDVTNTGAIETSGDLSDAIMAQSIGGGGGDGGETLTQNGVLGKFILGLGGQGGSNGNGGNVMVKAGMSDELLQTFGNGSAGVFAQSVGGGGGMAFVMSTGPAGAGGTARSELGLNNGIILPDTTFVDMKFNGPGGASGSAGTVTVNLVSPPVANPGGLMVTYGTDAYGVLAQSVGAGGGVIEGVTKGDLPSLGGLFSSTSAGHGGDVTVNLANAYSVYTEGVGAAGVLAQSVGGGGGIINGLSLVDLTQPIRFVPTLEYGGGGNVTVTLTNGGNIVTNGARADGIFAESVGGGGGLIGSPGGEGYIFSGSGNTSGCSGPSCPGKVSVSVSSTVVRTFGAGAYGVVVVSAGNGNNATRINLGAGGQIQSYGNSAAAIFIDGVGGNVVDNAGVIAGSSTTGVAIAGNYGATITNHNGGVIIGSTVLPGLSRFENLAGAVYAPGDEVQLAGGTLDNAGTLSPGGDATIADTAIRGGLVEAAGSKLIVSEQPGTGRADHLAVDGAAAIGGQIAVAVVPHTVLAPGVTQEDIVTASSGVSGEPVLDNTPVLSLRLARPDPDDLNLLTTINFRSAALEASGLATPNRDAIGNALNAIETAGVPAFDDLADAVAQLPTARVLAATYDSLSGEAVADAGQVTLATMREMNIRLAAQAGPFSGNSDGIAISPARPDLRAWISGFGGTEQLSGGPTNAGLNFQIEGGIAGLEKWFSADAMIGIAAGGSNANYRVSGQTPNGHSTGGELALYGLQRQGRFYLSGVFSFGHFGLGARRNDIASLAGVNDAVDDSFNHNAVAGRLEIGLRTQLAGMHVAPFAALEVDRLWQNGFSESAAAAPVALRFASAGETSIPLELGVRIAHDFELADGDVLSPAARLAWVHEFETRHCLTAAFTQAPQDDFVVESIANPANAAQLALGGVLALPSGMRFSADFDSQLSARQTAYGGVAQISLEW